VVGANVVDVPYWLDADRFGLESLREGVERFARVSDSVEITTTRSGSLYMSASKASVSVLGSEYRGLRVLPADVDEYDADAREPAGFSARLAEIKSTTAGSTESDGDSVGYMVRVPVIDEADGIDD
jgi:HUS1 checkpoint protein